MTPRWAAFGRSLVFRLYLVALSFAVIGVVTRILFLLPIVKDSLTGLVADSQLAIAQYVARDIDSAVRQRLDYVDRLAHRLPPALLADPPALATWLHDAHDIHPLFSNGLMVVPVGGHGLIAQFPLVPGRAGIDYTDAIWLTDAVKTRKPAIGKPIRGRATSEPLIIMAAPVMGPQGEPVAVLAGVTMLAAPGFLNILQETTIGENGGFLLLAPRDDLFVAATDTSKVLTPLPRPGVNPLHDRAMQGFRGTGITTNIAGIEELSAMASVPAAGWFLVARVPTRDAFALVNRIATFLFRQAVLGGALIAVVMAGILILFFRPLTTTSRLIRRMALGELELQPVPVVRADEVGELAEGFNFLLSRLEAITAQKVEQERAREAEKHRIVGRILEASPIGVALVASPGGQLLFANSRFRALTGSDRREGTLLPELFAAPAELAGLLRDMAAGRERTDAELELAHPDGPRFWTLTTLLPLESSGAELLVWIYDITERKQAEDLLLAKSQELERMEASLRQWMADASHELRTPISVLRAQVEAIQDGIHQVDSARLGVLHREAMGLSRLVDDLYMLARSDVGQFECRADPLSPLGQLDDVIAAFGTRYAAADLAIAWADRPDVEPIVAGDPVRLRQVFSNLLENTLRYTDAGGRLRITCALESASLELHFDDTAPGVPTDSLARLFTRFYRVDSSRSRDRGGSGIGLAVCRGIIAAHGGTIIAAPSPLGGLRVTITLPRPA